MSLVSLLQVGFGIWAFFTLLFVIAYLKRDISFIDIGWGPGFSILFLLIIVIQDYAISSLQLSQGIIVALWSLRLFTYLYMRNKSKGEDRRYQELAKNWKGSRWVNAYFRVYTVQAITSPDARYDEFRQGVDWIQKHIFPGSLLPSVARMVECVNSTGEMQLIHLRDMGTHYAKTLRMWREGFNQYWT